MVDKREPYPLHPDAQKAKEALDVPISNEENPKRKISASTILLVCLFILLMIGGMVLIGYY